MNNTPKAGLLLAAAATLLVIGGVFYLFGQSETAVAPTQVDENKDGLVTARLGQAVTLLGVTITPLEVLEDSRCPTDVTCIQAGRVRLRATLLSGLGQTEQVFTIGEPVQTGAEEIALVEVQPAKVSTVTVTNAEYRFVFKIQKGVGLVYQNASADKIRVSTPLPGAVVGKEFEVRGEARGTWYFEASFPIYVVDGGGAVLATGIAQAQSEWMTEDFVPFIAPITIPASYIGPATLRVQRDNPSGEPAYDASVSFPIIIEY